MLFLQRGYLWANHDVWYVSECHKWFNHCLISHDFLQGSSSKDNNIPTVLQLILDLLLMFIPFSLIIHHLLFQFIVSYVLLPLRLLILALIILLFILWWNLIFLHSVIDFLLHFCLFLVLRLLFHPFSHCLKSILNLLHHHTFTSRINNQGLSTALEHSQTVQGGQVRLLIFFWYNPRLNTV